VVNENRSTTFVLKANPRCHKYHGPLPVSDWGNMSSFNWYTLRVLISLITVFQLHGKCEVLGYFKRINWKEVIVWPFEVWILTTLCTYEDSVLVLLLYIWYLKAVQGHDGCVLSYSTDRHRNSQCRHNAEFYVQASVHLESMSKTVQQDATLYSFYSLKTSLRVSSDNFTHHQERQ
jgi:hypothetical protein